MLGGLGASAYFIYGIAVHRYKDPSYLTPNAYGYDYAGTPFQAGYMALVCTMLFGLLNTALLQRYGHRLVCENWGLGGCRCACII